MRASNLPRSVVGLTAIAVLSATALSAQANPAHTHIGHVADGFGGTPDGQGLLPTAVAEAEIAAQHAGLAARDPSNLDVMKRHIEHVLHAIDPTVVESGPGLGYGVKQAAEGIVRHIELAANADSASDNVKTHARHVATAARNSVQRAGAIVALAQRIRDATSATDAAALLEELTALSDALIPGTDANRDGGVGLREGEAGLRQATQDMRIVKRGEGLSN